MKLNRLETHDRYEHFINQSFDIGKCCQNIIEQRPFGNHQFYIYAHARTAEDGVTKNLIWQPRLTKPKSQTNSMLFKVYPGNDKVKIIWVIPARELWKQYSTGLITQSSIISESIRDFQYDRHKLDKKDEDDLTDDQIDSIYRELSMQARHDKRMKSLHNVKQETLEPFSVSLE